MFFFISDTILTRWCYIDLKGAYISLAPNRTKYYFYCHFFLSTIIPLPPLQLLHMPNHTHRTLSLLLLPRNCENKTSSCCPKDLLCHQLVFFRLTNKWVLLQWPVTQCYTHFWLWHFLKLHLLWKPLACFCWFFNVM